MVCLSRRGRKDSPLYYVLFISSILAYADDSIGETAYDDDSIGESNLYWKAQSQQFKSKKKLVELRVCVVYSAAPMKDDHPKKCLLSRIIFNLIFLKKKNEFRMMEKIQII